MSELPPPPPPPPNLGPPPGYVPYAQPLQYGPGTQRIGTLTKWLVGLLGVTIGTQALSVGLQLTLRRDAINFLSGPINGFTTSDFEDKLAPYLTVGALTAVVGLAQMVILIIWTFRMARNARTLGREGQKFAPGATIAINLLGGCTLGILPFFMWREIWRASDPEVFPGDTTWRQRGASPLIAIHLGLTLTATAVGIVVGLDRAFTQFRTSKTTEELAKEFKDQVAVSVISGLFTIAATAVFIMFVRQLAARHMRTTAEV